MIYQLEARRLCMETSEHDLAFSTRAWCLPCRWSREDCLQELRPCVWRTLRWLVVMSIRRRRWRLKGSPHASEVDLNSPSASSPQHRTMPAFPYLHSQAFLMATCNHQARECYCLVQPPLIFFLHSKQDKHSNKKSAVPHPP